MANSVSVPATALPPAAVYGRGGRLAAKQLYCALATRFRYFSLRWVDRESRFILSGVSLVSDFDLRQLIGGVSSSIWAPQLSHQLEGGEFVISFTALPFL